MSIYDKPPHDHFWFVQHLTNGDVTKHKSKLKELYLTPYVWFLSYIDKAQKKDK